jgi:uncharacterized protein GlcG (DUF336 family)
MTRNGTSVPTLIMTGGVPIVVAGKIIGAVGVSGCTVLMLGKQHPTIARTVMAFQFLPLAAGFIRAHPK